MKVESFVFVYALSLRFKRFFQGSEVDRLQFSAAQLKLHLEETFQPANFGTWEKPFFKVICTLLKGSLRLGVVFNVSESFLPHFETLKGLMIPNAGTPRLAQFFQRTDEELKLWPCARSLLLLLLLQGGPTEFYPWNWVFHLLDERSLCIFSMTYLKQHTQYFHFRCIIQLDHPVHCRPRFRGGIASHFINSDSKAAAFPAPFPPLMDLSLRFAPSLFPPLTPSRELWSRSSRSCWRSEYPELS